ncbi:hypothetical protein BJX61DRAFT_517913 [Aspergillus egyptiacus]|nr:hypothetical protein BJX61DRAFT_517913 [Aspergillus egyptiacus]
MVIGQLALLLETTSGRLTGCTDYYGDEVQDSDLEAPIVVSLQRWPRQGAQVQAVVVPNTVPTSLDVHYFVSG